MEKSTAAPCLKKLFIQLNTSLPASAAAERLFSCCGLTEQLRTRLNDKRFKAMVMLKVNKHIILYVMFCVTCYIYIAYSNTTENVF